MKKNKTRNMWVKGVLVHALQQRNLQEVIGKSEDDKQAVDDGQISYETGYINNGQIIKPC